MFHRLRQLPVPFLLLAAMGVVLGVALGWSFLWPSRSPLADRTPDRVRNNSPLPPLKLASGHHLTVWWDAFDPVTKLNSRQFGDRSNIHPVDYTGPAACQKCHPTQHQQWSEHPHRGMNALADQNTIKGDFSGKSSIAYRGGRATFERAGDGAYLMKLERGESRRTYHITQTIGVRFYQYYVGKQIEGPEPPSHHFYQKDHVLPFGYWLDRKEWVPIVHIGPELPDDSRPDPFVPPEKGSHYAEYAVSCNFCHTTFPLGDMFARRPHQMGEHAPLSMHWSMKGYLDKAHPQVYEAMAQMIASGTATQNPMADWDAPRYAVTLGVSCEACHLGAKAHAESGGKILPEFFPTSPQLSLESVRAPDPGRTHDNINWACGRCHTGSRPMFAAGMSTWNSVEYADAAKGACYTKLRCIDCHPPHQALGPKWTQLPERDDATCLKCHDKFQEPNRRVAHTHHPAGSAGDRCLNCHMPRINEGLQDVVRTHMIYSPTRADMLQANHPNACNLCHTDRSIDWTLGYLKDWYAKSYDEREISLHYRDRNEPVALGWLGHSDPSVRLVAADALARTRNAQALPKLIDALDDPYLLNRQFTAKGLEEMLGVRLSDYGYHFYQTQVERVGPLATIRAKSFSVPGAKP